MGIQLPEQTFIRPTKRLIVSENISWQRTALLETSVLVSPRRHGLGIRGRTFPGNWETLFPYLRPFLAGFVFIQSSSFQDQFRERCDFAWKTGNFRSVFPRYRSQDRCWDVFSFLRFS